VTKYDFTIIGSGIAGLYVALLAKDQGKVLIITKGSIDDCNTRYAQGGIAAAIGKGDSPDLHFQDTLVSGADVCDPAAVRILVEEASYCIADLIRLGVPFDTVHGEIALGLEAAHSAPRIVHAGGDATGEHIELTLSRRIRSSEVEVLEHSLATRLLVEEGRMRGVRILDVHTGESEEFSSPQVILATGGAGKLFKFTTNSEVATGDGVALAFEAGAEVSDMEFFQFHPTVLHLPGVEPFLISEAVRGEGGVLRNIHGRRFMFDYSPQGELAPRDVVCRSILEEMRKTKSNHVLLDATFLPPQLTTSRFPHIFRFCLEHGLDITSQPIPVSPAAHYMIGGVKTNIYGETSIQGLFACGEVACTYVHGANRLASNSLMEALVWARRIFAPAKDRMDKAEPIHYLPLRFPSSTPPLNLSSLQELMWDKVGILRSGKELEEAADALAAWNEEIGDPSDRPTCELKNLIITGRLMSEAALLRQESRGAHFRSDFPSLSPEFKKHIVFKKKDEA
jgi:L-aspartate oxidase